MAIQIFDTNQKPGDEKEFIKWMEAKFGIPNDIAKNNYCSNVARLRDAFTSHPFWQKVGKQLTDWDADYYAQNQVHLFSNNKLPAWVDKPYESLLNKAYRKDCLNNKVFPKAPEKGWISPKTWFDGIHDIIRTSFVVKYLDGVKFLAQKLEDVAGEIGCQYGCSYEAHDDGYYAAHVAIVLEMMIVGLDWQESIHQIEVEIQITTELQEMVKNLLHKYYEDNRRKAISSDYKWQWDHHNEQFVPNYMGHIAHYLEGMIVEIRDKQKKVL